MWSSFLDGARGAIQDEKPLGSEMSALKHFTRRCPLQEFLDAGEVRALFTPPSYAEKQSFANKHFVGGLPESVMPVESLYLPWSSVSVNEAPFSHKKGLYQGDSALYMQKLIERFGLCLPEYFRAFPDHIAVELDLLAVMLRSGMQDEASVFLSERFEWLTALRMRLLHLDDDASFYIGLIDVLLGIKAQQEPGTILT
jgi:TorA maturation chaperone TorD